MRVALVGSGVLPIPPPGWGAVERAIAGLELGLRGLGVDVQVINRPGNGRSRDEYGFALRLGSRLGPGPWDIVHASTPVVANRLAFSGVPYVYTSHSRHWLGGVGSLSQRWGFWLERRACAKAARLVALTEEVAREMRHRCGEGMAPRTRVIPNGIEVGRFQPRWEERSGSRIIGVGAVHPRKDWKTAAEVVRDLPGATLTIVGPIQDQSYATELRALAGPDRLELVGQVSDAELARRLGTSDVFLFPSVSELMSIAVMEAMASGLPVVGTWAVQGLVTQGTTGYTAEPGTPPAALPRFLRERVAELLADPAKRRALGEAGREHARTHWDWSSVAREVLNVYAELTPG